MTRTVKVKLTADHADLKTKMREAGDAAKQMGATTAAAAGVATAGLKGTERAAEDLGDALDDAADQGQSLVGLAAEVRKLDVEIGKAEDSVRDLAREFARTGDNTVLDRLRAQRRELNQMRDVRKLLPSPIEAAAAGGCDGDVERHCRGAREVEERLRGGRVGAASAAGRRVGPGKVGRLGAVLGHGHDGRGGGGGGGGAAAAGRRGGPPRARD